MNHVLRPHHEFDPLPGGHVQFIDLARPMRVLNFPHPLFAEDLDGERRSRGRFMRAYRRVPQKNMTSMSTNGIKLQMTSSDVD